MISGGIVVNRFAEIRLISETKFDDDLFFNQSIENDHQNLSRLVQVYLKPQIWIKLTN